MHVDEKLTNETFPAEPEKATLEGKISLSVLVISWRRNGVVRFLVWHIFGTKNSTNGGATSQEMFQMPLVLL